MSTILIIILILFLIKLLRDSLFYVWLWQVKMYRIDRMTSHLKDNSNILKNNLVYIFAISIFFLSLIFSKDNSSFFQFLVLILFAGSFLQIIKEIKNRFFRRPKTTVKVFLIFSIAIILYGLFIAIYWIFASAGIIDIRIEVSIKFLLLVYLIYPFVIFFSVLIANPFFNYKKHKILKKATEKMEKLEKVKVIGITGSYGKTSTKEFLYEILSSKYKVVKTEGNNNTNIGVAYTVLNKVNDEFDYFICEMGAYKIGDIVEICDIVKPEIGILTGINEQHLELFGSIENTRKTKFELIEALPEDGFTVINEKIKNYKPKTKVQNIKYFSSGNAENIKVYQNYMEFDIKMIFNCHSEWSDSETKNPVTMHDELDNGIVTLPMVAHNDREVVKFRLNLLGKHYIENIISAIIVAEHLGMNLDEISKAVEKIEPTEYMMRKMDGPTDSVFIDDSYSANPDGVMAALDYLEEAYQDYRKIIVFPGIIELGNESEKIHEKLFNRIADVCDKAYIMNDDLRNTPYLLRRFTTLKRGIKKEEISKGNDKIEKKNCEFIFEKDFDKVAGMVEKALDKNTVVLFESRGAGVVMGKLR